MPLSDTNPKTRFGVAKPGISAIPPVALLHCGRGMEDGKIKYGLTNWRENEVAASVYYDAAFRHLASWWDGEQNASDSGVHHLGHVMACCAILLDAEAQGKLNDDRPAIPGAFSRMVKEMTRAMDAESEGEAMFFHLKAPVRRDADFATARRLADAYMAHKSDRIKAEKKGEVVSFLEHLGAKKVMELRGDAFLRFAFYIDLRNEGSKHSPEQMDDMLESSGYIDRAA